VGTEDLAAVSALCIAVDTTVGFVGSMDIDSLVVAAVVVTCSGRNRTTLFAVGSEMGHEGRPGQHVVAVLVVDAAAAAAAAAARMPHSMGFSYGGSAAHMRFGLVFAADTSAEAVGIGYRHTAAVLRDEEAAAERKSESGSSSVLATTRFVVSASASAVVVRNTVSAAYWHPFLFLPPCPRHSHFRSLVLLTMREPLRVRR